MPIDSSIALNPGNPGNNLISSLGMATQLRGQIQAQKANGALSSILQQSYDPTTGQIDYNKVTQLASQNPDAAYNLPQLQGQVLQQRTNQLDYDAKAFELAQKQNDTLSAAFGGLLTKQNISPADIMRIGAQGVRAGLFNDKQVIDFTSDLPNDPAQLREWVKQHYVGFSQNSDRLKTVQPQLQTINTGAQQVVAGFDPQTGAATGQTTVFNNQLSPEAASTPTQVFDPATGTMRSVTRQQFSNMANGQGAPQGYIPDTAGGSLGSGRLTPITGGAPGLQAAPALGSQEAAQVVGKSAAEASVNLQSQADAAPQAIYQLQNMRSALTDIDTGPNADWQGKAQALALQVAPGLAQKIGIDPQKVASLEEFKKYTTQLAQAVSSSLGEGTDSKLASAVAANPNTSLSKLGNQQIIDVLIATQRATTAKNQAWQASGLPPEQFNKFSSQWNRDIDPRVFAAQDMDQAQAQKMIQSLPPKDQIAFARSWQRANQLGYVQ